MQELWSSASYEAHLLSLPFALAPVAMLIVIAYAAVMRGSPMLRLWLLGHCLALLPYAIVMMLSPSITDGRVAEKLFQVAVSFIPMAAATGTAFQLSLLRRFTRYRWLIAACVAQAAVWVVVSSTTNLTISGVTWMNGYWYPTAGSWAWVAVLHTFLLSAPGFYFLGRSAVFGRPTVERRQLRATLVANTVTYSGLVDVALAYGAPIVPLGWLLSGIGSLLIVRALVFEDLLRVRAVDTTAPLLVAFFASGILLGWIVLTLVGSSSGVGDPPWWVVTLALVMTLGAVRASVATISLVQRGGRLGDGPLERLLAQLVGRARRETAAPHIARLAIDIIELGIGVRTKILLAAEEDWGWTRETGENVTDELAPDPLLVAWLSERGAPDHRGALFADDLDPVPADLRDLAMQLFERNEARAIVPVTSADELIALVVVPSSAGRLRGRPLDFLERGGERLAEALLHARMARRAAERASLAREVELAATVQGELLPGKGPHVFGPITVVGSWQPATRCAGDFWQVYPLGEGRVLVAIGDVTGHGVASAMVTAAAIGACDVVVRANATSVDLRELIVALDAAVRRVGGGALAMTCFAAILDPKAQEVRFVSCGHTTPYLCRPADKTIELHALVGRGNPLGGNLSVAPKVQQRQIQAGDLLVWYTDGVIDAQDPAGAPFGDRRLQHLLKRLDRTRLAPNAVHAVVQSGIAAHRAGRPLADDETVVVARLAPEAGAAAS
ncbi:MAG: SpoIIE family protein phosphatase [Kofleriaceae bacterium]